LSSVAIGFGYISISEFYIKEPEFFLYPIIATVCNIIFGMISIKMMMEVSEITNNRLGSLQEMAYYFT
jgi:hypothetical protein